MRYIPALNMVWKMVGGGIAVKKSILVIQGGGRPNGNTAQLVRHFVCGAEDSGHRLEVISLLKQEVKGCIGCNACRYGKPCVQKDAFNDLVPKIKAADCIVFASPLYFWTLSSKIKAFIERFLVTISFTALFATAPIAFILFLLLFIVQ